MRIGIVHYRVGRTDGVSLEIEKRQRILEGMGHDVFTIAGPVSMGASFIIPELEFDRPDVVSIKERSFASFGSDSVSKDDLMADIEGLSARIEDAFLDIHSQVSFDALLLHNIFSHGRHIAAASAFRRICQRLEIPVIATHHDFYWEREIYVPARFPEITDYLRENVPPDLPNIRHIVINSLAGEELWRRCGISSCVLPDIFDFDQPLWHRDEFNSSLLSRCGFNDSDLIVLQATRIVQRKGIEMAMQLVRKLGDCRHELVGQKLYNGKVLTADSRIILLLTGYAEDASLDYLEQLRDLAKSYGMDAIFAYDLFGAERQTDPVKYSLWDAYAFADLVTYPSLVEGWGNQFIEAVFARKPIVLFEYPVFLADIKPEGYGYISLGKTANQNQQSRLYSLPENTVDSAVSSLVEWLLNPDTSQRLSRNAEIGKRNHGFPVMERFLRTSLLP